MLYKFLKNPKESNFAILSDKELDILKTLLKAKLDNKSVVPVKDLVKLDKDELEIIKKLYEKELINVEFYNNSLFDLYFKSISLSPLFFEILEYKDDVEIIDSPYEKESQFLKEQFERAELYYKLYLHKKKNKHSIKIPFIKKKIKLIETRIAKRLSATKEGIFLVDLLRNLEISEKEEIIFFLLLREEFLKSNDDIRLLETLLGVVSNDLEEMIDNISLVDLDSKLVNEGLIDFEESDFFGGGRRYYITDNILENLVSSRKNHKINILIKDTMFDLLEPRVTLNDLILPEATKKSIDTFLSQFDEKVLEKLKKWGIKDNIMSAKILFYGPPGTGKTMSAYAIANVLNKPILSLDSSKILSAYVGESEKNVRRLFDEYYEISDKLKTPPVLLLNEADQFLSSRSTHAISSADKMHNQMQNIFLEQIERFDGILIATTNLLETIDEAFSRRFDFKVKFEKPSFKDRVKLWKIKLPKEAKYEGEFDVDKLAKYPLTGAQIEVVIKNTALKVAMRGDDIFRVSDFVEVIEKELKSDFGGYKEVGFSV
ncbi:MAG: ATP-binding protein [Nautiliaceae bacterium]